jgi:hypothetical protein
MEIRGKVLSKGDVVARTDKFKVQEFFLDCSTYDQYTGEKRENIIKLQVINGNIEKFSSVTVGMEVKIHFQINGRFFEWQDKEMHSQNLTAYSWEEVKYNYVPKTPVVPVSSPEDKKDTEKESTTDENFDDLPF